MVRDVPPQTPNLEEAVGAPNKNEETPKVPAHTPGHSVVEGADEPGAQKELTAHAAEGR